MPILYEYSGSISRLSVLTIMSGIETVLVDRQVARWYINRVCGVCAEMVDNLYKHAEYGPLDSAGAEHYPDGPPVRIEFKQHGVCCMIETENYVSGSRKERLQNRLAKINSTPVSVLRDQYLSVLSQCLTASSGRGGLGLLDISKKVARPLRYSFETVAPGLWIYKLSVIILN